MKLKETKKKGEKTTSRMSTQVGVMLTVLTISRRVNISQVITSGQDFEVDCEIYTCVDGICGVNRNMIVEAYRR